MIGNRCGHDPARPRWFQPPARHAARPRVLQRLIIRIRDYYDSPQRVLPILNSINNSDRRQRSERREACLGLLGCLIHYLDLDKLHVGVPQPDGSLGGLTMEFLSKRSGLGLRRAERAIHDLAAAGIISIHYRAQRLDDGSHKGLAAVRSLSRSLFDALGLGGWLRHEREKAAKRRERKLHKANPRALANVRMAIDRKLCRKSQTSTEHSTTGPRAAHEILAAIKASLKGRGPPS